MNKTDAPTAGVQTHLLSIGGRRVPAVDGATMAVIDPATEEHIADVPAGGSKDVADAVQAAAAAAPSWAALSWTARATRLFELSRRIDAMRDEFALMDTVDSGCPISGMTGDAKRAAEELRYFAGLGGETKGDTIPGTPDQFGLSFREPYGVVGRLTAFNHPFLFAVGKTAAALIAGNAVVLKPSEHTSLSTLRFAELAAEVLPEGVLNIVTGTGAEAGNALVTHPDVPRIAFTGGVPTARAILSAAAPGIKAVSAELGGKNPLVVFPDVDVPTAVKGAVAGMNIRRSAGQSCQSNSRMIVHRSIAEEFADLLVQEIESARIGDPRNPETEVGPLCFKAHYDRVMGYIAAGKSEGATVLTGGGRPAGLDRGYFVAPTVFTDVQPGMRIATEEVFGPVVSLFVWDDYEDMIALANGVEYGLTANIWTNNLTLAHRTAQRIQAGMIWVNGNGTRPIGVPFGGFKHSGLGKEGSLSEVLDYTREKAVIMNLV
jgi:betaine-aldehyde dehydrogenase